jgi:hypothetical protein
MEDEQKQLAKAVPGEIVTISRAGLRIAHPYVSIYSRDDMTCPISHHVMSCHVMSCHVMSCHIFILCVCCVLLVLYTMNR